LESEIKNKQDRLVLRQMGKKKVKSQEEVVLCLDGVQEAEAAAAGWKCMSCDRQMLEANCV
jgi:hypothetical protein